MEKKSSFLKQCTDSGTTHQATHATTKESYRNIYSCCRPKRKQVQRFVTVLLRCTICIVGLVRRINPYITRNEPAKNKQTDDRRYALATVARQQLAIAPVVVGCCETYEEIENLPHDRE